MKTNWVDVVFWVGMVLCCMFGLAAEHGCRVQCGTMIVEIPSDGGAK